jgi:hypothetical protein
MESQGEKNLPLSSSLLEKMVKGSPGKKTGTAVLPGQSGWVEVPF